MAIALGVRDDLPAAELRRRARLEQEARVACRMLALANALDGMSRAEAAMRAGLDRQALRDWVIRYNAEGLAGLRDRPRSGRRSFLDPAQRAALKALVLAGPDPETDGVSTWRAQDIRRLVKTRFQQSYSENGMLKVLHGLGLSWQKARPVHPSADHEAQEAFKKNLPGADRRPRRAATAGAARDLVPG
jgi:transposase